MAFNLTSKMRQLFRDLSLPEEDVTSVDLEVEMINTAPERSPDGNLWIQHAKTGYMQLIVKYEDGRTRWRAYNVDSDGHFIEEAEWRPLRPRSL